MLRFAVRLAALLLLGCAARSAALDGTWASLGADREVLVFLGLDEYRLYGYRRVDGRQTTFLARGTYAVNGSRIELRQRMAADTKKAQGWKEEPVVRTLPFRAGDGALEVDGVRFGRFPDALRAIDSAERLYAFCDLALWTAEAKVPGWGSMGMKGGTYPGEISGKMDLSISIALVGPTVTRFRFTDYSDFQGLTLDGEMEIRVNLDWGKLSGGMKGTLEMRGAVSGSVCYDGLSIVGGQIKDGFYAIRFRDAVADLPHRSPRRIRFNDFRLFP